MAVQEVADVRGDHDRLDPRLYRALFLAADEGVLSARSTLPAGFRGAGSDAGAARSLSGRPQRGRKRQRRMAGGKSHAGPGRHGGRAGRLEPHRGLFPDRLSRPARIGAAGKGRARDGRTPRRHDQPELRQWPDGARAQRPQRAGGEPAQQRAACQRLRRPRALLDLPHSRDRRLRRTPRTVQARSVRAQPGRRGLRPRDPPRLPAAARDRPFLLPDLPAADHRGQFADLQSLAHRRGALSRQHVRRHARLDQTWRKSGCRSTPSSSSTAFSARCRRR